VVGQQAAHRLVSHPRLARREFPAQQHEPNCPDRLIQAALDVPPDVRRHAADVVGSGGMHPEQDRVGQVAYSRQPAAEHLLGQRGLPLDLCPAGISRARRSHRPRR
jgi:hypothetical protein